MQDDRPDKMEIARDDSFIVEWYKGPVLLNNDSVGIDVLIKKSFKTSGDIFGSIRIDETKYQLTQELYDQIYEYVEENIEKLIKVALSQDYKPIDKVGGGVDNLYIKYKSVYLHLNKENVSQFSQGYIATFEKSLEDMIKNSANS